MPVSAPHGELAADVSKGLAAHPKRLPPKYFYDALGSTLFDAICRLPWYGITRAEHRLLTAHAGAIVHGTRAGHADVTLVELGCGDGSKLARVVRELDAAGVPAAVHLVDVSTQALRQTERRLRRFRGARVTMHAATYEAGLARLPAERAGDGPALMLFLGSNIGNFDPPDAVQLLTRMRAALRPGDRLLLGADLVKPQADLELAYDDPLGVTAAFNKNVLVRLNRELGADFDLSAFDHAARWNAPASRVEMHLVSRRAQTVTIGAIDMGVAFAAGESIWTESSYKYEPDEIVSMGAMTGLSVAGQWIDRRARFALTLFAFD